MSGGGLGSYGIDPIDGDVGYRRAGRNYRREIPPWTREKSRDYAVTSYRTNPMCTAVLDTYTSFCVGDSGVSPTVTDDRVREVVEEFWNDPANRLGDIQEMMLRSHMLWGEMLLEMMVGAQSGAVRFCPYEPAQIVDVHTYKGNPLWIDTVVMPPKDDSEGDNQRWKVVRVNDDSGLREGEAFFWVPWRALLTDTRCGPFIAPILDWLDNYDTVLSNLMDRTELARYAAFDVTVQDDGSGDAVNKYIAGRGGRTLPPSGSIEVHNQSVEWKPLQVSSGADEDSKTAGAILTNVASGSGLARTWLADPEDANRATSQTMAEPVRRRVGGLQRVWLSQMTELCRFAVDRAVAAKRLDATVTVKDPRTGAEKEMPAAQSVIVTGPAISAEDAQFTANVLLNLSTGLEKLQQIGALSEEAVKLAAQKAWEGYMGVPFRPELASSTANVDDIATHVDATSPAGIAPPAPLTLVG